jgi:Tol biopolymer transport system component
MKYFVPVLFFLFAGSAIAQKSPVGIFEDHVDVGKPKNPGSAQYDQNTQVYTISGAGYNIWFGRDEFHFLYNKIKGDFILTANFELVGKGTDPHRKIGWMIRGSLNENAAHASAVAHGDGLTVLQWRELPGALMRDPEDEIFFPKKNFQIIQLERIGKTITMRVAHKGEPLQTIGSHEMTSMPEEVFAGLYICSHNEAVVEQARIWNVRIDKPVPDSYNGYKDGALPSRLEILTLADGSRKVIHEAPTRFEAPNWTPGGKKLIYNEGGSLYSISPTGGTPEKINTDFANRNNNDHGISFDGKMLAISHHRDGLPGGGSTIYVVPVQGGTPKQVTEKTPSYWHGWNPNNKEVVFVAQRDGKNYDIYKAPINGGPEVKLTSNTTAHVDGPEYTPDGKYIYYNASTTGTMQIWRMKPDGSAQEQITFDEYNNWFPHFSPDGKWIAFISFLPNIDPNDHPLYKRVMLRLMPASGGAPRVIAYLFGGQGTINVPSWSPDSKFLAFVSNTK